MEIFTVTMFRYGNKESHNYVLGCYSSFDLAKMNGNGELLWRGNKYFFEIVRSILDRPNDIDYCSEVVYTLEQSKNNE